MASQPVTISDLTAAEIASAGFDLEAEILADAREMVNAEIDAFAKTLIDGDPRTQEPEGFLVVRC